MVNNGGVAGSPWGPVCSGSCPCLCAWASKVILVGAYCCTTLCAWASKVIGVYCGGPGPARPVSGCHKN